MAQGAHGFKGWLGVGFAGVSDLRQAVPSRTAFARFHDIEVTEAQGEEIDPTSGRSDPESVSLGDYDLKVKATLEGTTEGCIAPLARSLLGGAFTDSTVGTTGKQHLGVLADTVPNNARLGCEVRYGTDAESENFNAVCDSLEFNLNQAGYARWVASLIGSSPAYNASPTSPTLPAIATLLSQRTTTFSLDADTTHVVRNLSWKLQRKMDQDDYDLTSRQRRDASYGELEATFDAELTFQTAVELRRFWGGAAATLPSDVDTYYAVNIKTERSDVIAGGTAKHTAAIDMPKCFLTKVSTPIHGRDVIRQKVQGRAIYDSVATYSAQFKLINTTASYP